MGELHDEVEGTGLDVGFLLHGWPPASLGGVECHAQDLARELAARGHRVHVLCLDTREGLEPWAVETATEDGVEVRRMAYRYQDHAALADVARNDRAADVVTAWLAETPCDVVHVHHLTGWGLSALRAVHDVGQPLVVTLHDYWPLCPRGQMLRADGVVCERAEAATCAPCIAATWPHLLPSQGARAEGPDGEPLADDAAAAEARTRYALAQLRLAHRLLVPSAAAREVWVRAGLDAAGLEVCENGIRADELRAAVELERERGQSVEDGIALGVLGSVQPSKGVLELARAVVEADVPVLTLEVHGGLDGYHGDTRYVEELRALADSDDRIRLRGPYTREELPGILAGLAGVAAPSRWNEVFGLTAREARAAGLPVLVSDAGGLPSAAQGGRAGIVVPRDDAEAWKRALWKFGSDPAQRDAWAEAPAEVRSVRDMMLRIERVYVETIIAVTGLEPHLVHPLADEPRPSPAARAQEPAPPARAPDAEPAPRKGFLGRLFGRR